MTRVVDVTGRARGSSLTMIVQQQTPKKAKLVITAFKVKPKLPADFEETSWAKLSDAVRAIQERRPVSSSLEELYRLVENLCLHKMSDRLYERLKKECDRHIGQSVAGLTQNLVLEPVVFLQHMEEIWQLHWTQMKRIGSIFLYLDRTYILSLLGVKSLFDMGLQLFREHLSKHPEVQEHTLAGLLTVIEQERTGYAVDRSNLKSLLKMFSLIGLYDTHFQPRFLERTALFYKEESETNLLQWDVPQYLLYCENRLAAEQDRSEQYLDRMTHRPLLQCVEEQLLRARIQNILQGFCTLMDDNRTADLGRLYTLCGKIDALHKLKVAFSDYIKARGTTIMMDEEKEKEMVLLLLDFKARLDNVLSASFQVKATDRNNEFHQALKDAFERFINQKENKPAELTAKFIDTKLRLGNKGQTEEELESLLDRVLAIFRFIQGKDVFEAYYKKDLAKRLLFAKSASIDAEKSMISKLKEECGFQFTNNLEGMFNDMEISRDTMDRFRKSPAVEPQICQFGPEMNVQVLNYGYWPTYTAIEARLPEELAQSQEVFKEFYLQKHHGRRLQWQNSLSTCMLKAHFSRGTKELQASLFQGIVLLLFNDTESLSFDEIKDSSQIEEKELKRTLQSLSYGKLKILLKEPKSAEISLSDRFSVNENFHDNRVRLCINTFQIKESGEENQKVNESILQDRQYQIDAAVVRIMKMRRTLSHKLLMSELSTQLRFPFKSIDIKKRIESLIEREYMDRTPADPGVYQYIA